MSVPVSLSLLVTTFEWPEALALVLAHIRRQTVLPDEVLVADDGSGPATAALIAREAATFPVPLLHCWQEHRGFRAGTIRNAAIARAQGEYLLQIDGDILLHPHAVAAHRSYARRGSFVQGSRALCDETTTQRLLRREPLRLGPLTPGIEHRVNALHLPWLAPFSGGTRDTVERIRGCHIAFWREDLLRVNGYDEAYQGWGREDSDLTLRLGHAGVQRRNLKFAAVAFHLWHPPRSRDAFSRNDERLTDARRARVIRAEVGVDRHFASDPSLSHA